jgi:hypothetical protein
MVDEQLARGRITPDDVARALERALTDRRPRLHYVVGRLPRTLIALERHLPGELFMRLYASWIARRLSRPRGAAQPVRSLSERGA